MKQSNKDLVVFGIDILPSSSPSSSREPHYALVILKGNKVVENHHDVALRRIIRLAWEYRPHIISLDNIYELGKNERSIVKVISMLPLETSIVQVNVDDHKVVKLWEVAKDAKLISEYSKFPPLKTAFLAATLALRGYGLKIKVYEEKTKIIVTKGRSLNPGGMSQSRYKRHIRGLILQATRKIKDALDEHGFDYDMIVRKTEHGLDGAVFIVYAPREKLYGIVSSMKGHDLRVIIKPVYREKIEFEKVEPKVLSKKKPLIIGIDPGTFAGVAILDIDGNVLDVFSGKNLDRQVIIKHLERYGKPLIIASDVSPPSETLEKLAATLHAKLYVPQQSLTQSEKEEIVKTYLKNIGSSLEIEDAHQRDALAAALDAWKSFKLKFEQIDNYISKLDLDLDLDKIKSEVIKGSSIALAIEKEIFRKLTSELKAKVSEEKSERVIKPQPQTHINESLLEEIRKLEFEKAYLKEKLSEAERKIWKLSKQLDEHRKQTNIQLKAIREIQTLSEEVRKLSEEIKKYEIENIKLQQELSNLKSIILQVGLGKYKLAKTLTTLTLTSISKVEREVGKIERNDIIYVLNPTFVQEDALNKMLKLEVLSVIVDNSTDEFKEVLENSGIPVIRIEEIKDYIVKVFGNILLYTEEVKKEAKIRREVLRKRLIEQKNINLEKLITEYRIERWGLGP